MRRLLMKKKENKLFKKEHTFVLNDIMNSTSNKGPDWYGSI